MTPDPPDTPPGPTDPFTSPEVPQPRRSDAHPAGTAGPADPGGRRPDYRQIRAHGQDILTASLAAAYDNYSLFLAQAPATPASPEATKAFQAACVAHLKHIEELMSIVEPYADQAAPPSGVTGTRTPSDMQLLLDTCRRSLAETPIPAAALAAITGIGTPPPDGSDG